MIQDSISGRGPTCGMSFAILKITMVNMQRKSNLDTIMSSVTVALLIYAPSAKVA